MENEITYDNFYIGTSAVFKGCKIPRRKPDYVSYKRYPHDDEPSSCYWYGKDKRGEYVIRCSDHWSYYIVNGEFHEGCGGIASCYWRLKTTKEIPLFGGQLAGKCYLNDFK